VEHLQPNFRWPLAAKLLMGPKNVGGEIMARRSSIIVQSLVEIERRTSAWEYNVWHFTGRKREVLTCRYCFSLADFCFFFAPQWRHVAPIKVKFGIEERTAPPCQIWEIGSGVWVYGPKTLKKWNFTNIISPKGRVPCTILTKFTIPRGQNSIFFKQTRPAVKGWPPETIST